MDRKSLMRVVIFGLILHILIVAFYISSHDNHEMAYMQRASPDEYEQYSNRREKDDEDNMISEVVRDNTLNFEIHQENSRTDGVKNNAPGNIHGKEEVVGNGRTEGDLQAEETALEHKGKNSENINDVSKKELSSSPFSSSSAQLSKGDASQQVSSAQRPSWKTLHDENHPQFDRAFSRNTKPVYLLQWEPSPNSLNYFKKVEDTEAFVYSAYLTNCTPPAVRLIGISPRNKLNLGPVFCHYLDADKTHVESQPGSMLALKDNHLLNHTASSVECSITAGLYPAFVTVTKSSRYEKEASALPIQYAPEKATRNLTLCFSPLHSFYNYTFQLVQSIELHRLLGASHFVFYNFSTTSQTDEILRFYEGQGLATVLPWPLPHLESWYYGQIAAINDCIYRNKMTSRYVVIVDTDEFVVPNNHSDLMKLLNDVTFTSELRDELKLNRTSNGHKTCKVLDHATLKTVNDISNTQTTPPAQRYGSFMFRCSFFAEKPLSLQEEDILKAEKLKPTKEQSDFFNAFHSEPMLYLKRNDEIYEHESRSKLIVRPETVVSHAIHKTVEHIAGYETAFVNTKAAFLHHYRPYKVKSLNTLDVSALKLKNKLYERLRGVVKRFPSIFINKPFTRFSYEHSNVKEDPS